MAEQPVSPEPPASTPEQDAALANLARLLAGVIKRDVDAELKARRSRRTFKSV
jgi:hypothetical protein